MRAFATREGRSYFAGWRRRPAYDRDQHLVLLNWRDSWHPGRILQLETYVREVAQRLLAEGHQVRALHGALPGRTATPSRRAYRYVRRGGHLTVYLWAAVHLAAGRLGALGRVSRVLEVQNGMPFCARPVHPHQVAVFVHHVHREQWSIWDRCWRGSAGSWSRASPCA